VIELHDIDLGVSAGERVALVGPNGSGKTTLLRLLAGIVRPAGGSLRIADRDVIDRRERARRIAIVPQTFALPFAFTAREVVSLGRTPYLAWFGTHSPHDRDAVGAAVRAVDLDDLADRPFAELSGGERQRVILAMALAQEPEILLLDEPTTHLDLAHELHLLELVRDLSVSRGLTVIAVLHDVALAASHFERVVVLDHGAIAADGRGYEVVTSSLLARVFAIAARVEWRDGMAAIVPAMTGTERSFRKLAT
jgi:iron complex transport system ATP-binding protein